MLEDILGDGLQACAHGVAGIVESAQEIKKALGTLAYVYYVDTTDNSMLRTGCLLPWKQRYLDVLEAPAAPPNFNEQPFRQKCRIVLDCMWMVESMLCAKGVVKHDERSECYLRSQFHEEHDHRLIEVLSVLHTCQQTFKTEISGVIQWLRECFQLLSLNLLLLCFGIRTSTSLQLVLLAFAWLLEPKAAVACAEIFAFKKPPRSCGPREAELDDTDPTILKMSPGF